MKMYKTKKLLGLSLVAMSIAGTAQAGEWSAGLNVGQASLPSTAGDLCEFAGDLTAVSSSALRSIFSCNVDDSDTSVGLNIGYNFTNTWGAELGYIDLGEASSTLNASTGFFVDTGTGSTKVVDIEYSAVYLVGTGTWDLSDKWSLTGRLGIAEVEADASIGSAGVNVSDDSSEAMAGFAFNYKFNANWSGDIRYDYFDTDDSIDNISLGIRYTFKK